MRYLIAISVGIFSVVWWPILPDLRIVMLALAVTTLLSIKLPIRYKKSAWLALCIGWGSCWGIYDAQQYLQHQLPELLNKQEIVITGSVDSLVETNRTNSRFRMAVESARLKSNEAIEIPITSVLLSWYQFKEPRTEVSPGERWQLTVRLRRPRGFRNPGAFDYQSWLVQQGYSATGYIRESARNKRIDSLPISIDRYRQKIRQAIMSSGLSPRGTAAVLALSIGDKKPIGEWWDDLARLGIVHLLVISGLHIGLIAGLGFKLGAALGRLILPLHWLFPSRVDQTLGSRWMAPFVGLTAGLAYSLLAGFSLPTQRAIIAVSVVMIAKLLYRRIDPWA
ncbi:MAG: competence protein ComEC, partial [Porticoccaceae bacterium]